METKRLKYTKNNNKLTRKKSVKPLPSKEEVQLELKVRDLRTKIYKNEELNISDKIFAKWYIKHFISDKVLSEFGKNLKHSRTWDIRSYSALKEFQKTILDSKNKNLSDEERTIYVLKSIFKLNQSLIKTDESKTNSLVDEVSNYYKNCFMSGKTNSKILFKSKNKIITVFFKEELIILDDLINSKTYSRDIKLSELNVFPNPRLAQQYIK